MDTSEIQEKNHLIKVKKYLQDVLQHIDFRIEKYKQDIKDETAYYGENRYGMDHIEKMSMRQLIEYKMISSDQLKAHKKKVSKLLQSPYFGRLDFKMNGKPVEEKIYIGIHNFYYDQEDKPIVYDWRAPVSSLFYEHESGTAQYSAPSGVITGEVLLKRQFKIRDGEMEYMLESSLNITDDVLQKELSRTSDDGMKNIVATIQRNQNAIIRNEQSGVLIIQGVAGSGKTSIALHRIAFLLYRFKDTLSSEDILIISPNNVFADYISNVLPELGEESVGEIQMEKLAEELLGKQYAFQTFFEQTAELLELHDEQLRERIQYKSSAEFLTCLDEYAEHVKKYLFVGRDTSVARCFMPGWLFDEVFQSYRDYSKVECVSDMTKMLTKKVENEYRTTFKADDRATLKKRINDMHKGVSLRETYTDMFAWMGKPQLFKQTKNGKLEYADVFPMAYLRMKLESKSIIPQDVKHLLIDEMQDYTPVQYAVIAKLFPCNKTILGDVNQSVNPYSSSTGETIKSFFPGASYVALNKSYRSSYEIMQFVQKISPNQELELIERHGEEPQIVACKDVADEVEKIVHFVDSFEASEYNTLGIICKTQSQAEALSIALQRVGKKVHLLTAQSTTFDQGIIVCTAHMAKGLEFDEVIVPHITDENYGTVMDKNLLYVACTRAMHLLILTHAGKRSKFVPGKE